MTIAHSGPRIPAPSGTTKRLVIFLHGYGANGDDLIDIGHHWQNLLPDTSFVSPHAPFSCQGAPFGREWFPLRMFTPEELWQGVHIAAPYLNAFIDSEMKEFSLSESQIALVGFSQGTMMSLHVGLRRAHALAGIVGFSGRLCLNPESGIDSLKHELKSKPPIFLNHGDCDPVVPVESLGKAKAALDELGVSCQTHVSHGLGHGIDMDGMNLASQFLKTAFGIS